MKAPVQYHPALRLEQMLGDPATPPNLLSFRHSMDWDEQEVFPESAVARFNGLLLHHIYVPPALGGRFDSCESFIALGRILARRNMSVAVSYSTMLWAVLGWIAGNPGQQQKLARAILERGEFPCLAYSEQSHGADLLANETTAQRDAAGRYRVTGEKWPINRARLSEWVVLLARTASAAHSRNHSLFLFQKAALDPREHQNLPGPKTHGLRGCDISAIRFNNCRLPPDARLGEEGDGLQLALKGFQVTRTFCSALSLGVGDSALRLVVDFALERELYGLRVAELPHARDTLANAYLSILIAECSAAAAARGLHLFPEQFANWSSIVKVQVARLSDHATQQLAAILGARAYLRETHAEGMFQKFLRDGAIVAVFDGSSVVCLDQLGTVLPKLCRRQLQMADEKKTAALFDLRHPLPPLTFDRLRVLGGSQDAVLQSLPLLARRLRSLLPDAHCNAALLKRLNAQTRRLERDLESLRASIRNAPGRQHQRNSAARIRSVERYGAIHSAVCCLGFWLYNRDHLGGFAARGEWIAAALDRQGDPFFRCGTLKPVLTDSLCEELFRQTRETRMYSLIPWPLASPGQIESTADKLWENSNPKT